MLIAAVLVSGGLQKPIYWLLAGFSSSCLILVLSQALSLIPPTLLLVEQSWILGEFTCYFVHVMSIIATVSSTLFILLIAFERSFTFFHSLELFQCHQLSQKANSTIDKL